MKFKVIYSSLVEEFLSTLQPKVQEKILNRIDRVASGEIVDAETFKKLEDTDIWEFRIRYGSNAYRIFSFWDTEAETLVITTHGFKKKTQKTPQKEIKKAEDIRKLYFDSKTQENGDAK